MNKSDRKYYRHQTFFFEGGVIGYNFQKLSELREVKKDRQTDEHGNKR